MAVDNNGVFVVVEVVAAVAVVYDVGDCDAYHCTVLDPDHPRSCCEVIS